MKTQAVVFDMDDTLYLERDYVRSGFLAVGVWVARNLAVEGFSARALARFVSGRRGRIFDDVLVELGLPPDPKTIAAMVAVYRSHRPQIQLLPDAAACLERLHRSMPLALITDGPRESQSAKAEALGLRQWLRPLILTAELGEGFAKPHPRAFELAREAAGVPGESCVYIADNPAKDFIAPRKLGWKTVRVRRPDSLHFSVAGGPDVDEEIEDLGPLAVIL